MGVSQAHRLFDVEREYHDRADVDLAAFLAQRPPLEDGPLAELIEADGRIRVQLGRSVELNRYLDAVRDLAIRPEPLDAAIDVTLRSMSAFGVPRRDAESQLIANYPALESAIREAAALGDAMLATEQLRERIAGGPERALPAPFGPPLPDGQPRYRLLALLGRGAAGQVYRAVDRLLSETGHEALVAVKVLSAGNPGLWSRERFIEEATKARRIDHPNVVRVMDRGVSDRDEEFIVYEHVAGGDLHAWTDARPRLAIDDAVALIAGVARGVQAAHGAGLVHCDLKPGNIVLSPEGHAKVADFGVAVRRDPWMTDRSGHTPGGSNGNGSSGRAEGSAPVAVDAPGGGGGGRVGNIAFISPEQYRMEPGALVPGSDIYAIGGVLYWLLTRRLPNGETVAEIERTHDPAAGRQKAPSLRDTRPAIDRDLDAIAARCLAPRPADRYQSAAQLADDLRAWLAREPIAWTRPSLLHKARLWTRRKPTLAATGAVTLALLVVAAIWIVNLRAQAETRRLHVAVADARMDWQKHLGDHRYKKVIALLDALQPLRGPDRWAVLPVVPYFDWALGTVILGDPVMDTPPWRDRLTIIREMLDESRTAHGPDALSTLCLESTLAFWLVCNRRPDEATPILASNREAWHRVLPPDQPWHQWLSALNECAAAQILAANAPRPLTPADRARLTSAASSIGAAYASIGRGSTETQFKSLLRRTLTELYARDVLNQPARVPPLQR